MPDAPALATLLAEQIQQTAAARRQAAAYQLIAKQAIHRLHAEQQEVTRLRQRYVALLEELRRYTRATVGRAA